MSACSKHTPSTCSAAREPLRKDDDDDDDDHDDDDDPFALCVYCRCDNVRVIAL